MDYDISNKIFRYEEGENGDVGDHGKGGNLLFLVKFSQDESFLLVCASSRNEVLEEVSKITNPKQVIISRLDTKFSLEFEPRKRPLKHVRDGPIIDNSKIPNFNFLDICLSSENTFPNVLILCVDTKNKGRMTHLPGHYSILSRWDFFKKIFTGKIAQPQKKKGKKKQPQNQTKFHIRCVKTFRKQHVEILLRYLYSPHETCEKWIPSEDVEELVSNTDDFNSLLNLSRKVGCLNFYLHLSYLFINERMKNCDLTLPVFTSDIENPKLFEEHKKHFEEDFYKKRFVINAKKIIEIWEEVMGLDMKVVENYIAVYLLEHCVGSVDRVKLLPKEVLQYKPVKYYIQENRDLMNMGRRNIVQKKEKKGSTTFPFELSVCGDYNFESFLRFKKSLFPEVCKVETELLELFQSEEAKEVKKTEEETRETKNFSSEFRRKERKIGRDLREAWVKDKERSVEFIRENNWRDQEVVREEDVLLTEDNELMKLQLRSNRYLLSDYVEDGDDGGEEEEEEERLCTNSCGKVGTKICTRCRSVYYCSRECQVSDWKKHKNLCGKMLKGRN